RSLPMSSSQPAAVPTTVSPSARDALLLKIAALGVRPFQHQVVQSPWHPIIDVPSLHRDIKDRIRSLIDGRGQVQAIRCLTVTANAGYGKTHLLAWTRELLEQRNNAVFVYVPPYTTGNSGSLS